MLVRLFWRHNIETVGLYWKVICVAFSAGGMCTHAARMLSQGTVRVVFCDPGQTLSCNHAVVLHSFESLFISIFESL
jgi:hypothetical protein